MSITVGQIVADILTEVDPKRRRWDEAAVVGQLNEAVRLLANENVFQRRDILIATAGKSFYTPLAPVKKVTKVWFNGTRLQGLTFGEIDQRLLEVDTAWQSNQSTPSYYCATPTGVRIAHAPNASGTALTFSASPSVTENAGLSVLGDRMWSALNSTTVTHFQPGDGVCTNAETASNNVWVEYYYHPKRVDLTMAIHERIELALLNYGLYRTLRNSRDPVDLQRRTDAYQMWEYEKGRLIGESSEFHMTSETVPRVSICHEF